LGIVDSKELVRIGDVGPSSRVIRFVEPTVYQLLRLLTSRPRREDVREGEEEGQKTEERGEGEEEGGESGRRVREKERRRDIQ
jgi:hypothetical protein